MNWNSIFPNISIQISASVVAWYGAIVSTLVGVASIYNVFRDRANIKIKYQPNRFIIGSHPRYLEGVSYLSISVINRGRRPIKIETASLKSFNEKKFIILPDSFSEEQRVITEENPTTTFLTQQSKLNLKDIYCIIINDGAGRTYKKYIRKFPTFTKIWIRIKKMIIPKEK